jgi:hypothetical protein
MIRLIVLAAMALALSSSPAEARYRVPWCGIYMARYFHKSDPRLAQARRWALEGINAGGPGIGIVVVWPHHVGVIVGIDTKSGLWMVHSGNDGDRIRTRPRLLRGAIAFRRVS